LLPQVCNRGILGKSFIKFFLPQVIKLSAGEFFVKEGEYAKYFGFLESGIMRAFFVNQEGKEYNKNFFIGPSIIGAYTSLLTNKRNKIAQQALTECAGYKASYDAITQLYDTHQDIERLSRKIAEHYFLEKEKKELEIALLDADKRYLILQEEYPDLEQKIPQYHIASYLSISPTQLSRIRRKLSGY